MIKVAGPRQISIVYIADNKYAMPTCVSMLSLKKNIMSESMATVYVICDGVSEDSQDRFLELQDERFTVNIIRVENPAYKELAKSCESFGNNYVTASALFKLSLCEILVEEDRVLYLDGDTLIQGGIEELFFMDIGEKYVAAVDDQLDKVIDGKSQMAAQADICAEHYFNSGVMLLNLKKMREDNVCEKLTDYRRNGKNYFMDQDAFNAVMGKNRCMLPFRYNFFSVCLEYYDLHEISERFFDGKQDSIEECITNADIVHFAGEYKPWRYNVPWFSELFMKYYRQSPYAVEIIILKSVMKAMRDDLLGMQRALTDAGKYVFPYEKIRRNEKIILYGAGKIGKLYYGQIMETGYCEIVAWVDSNYREHESPVEAPEIINGREFSKVLISIASDRIAREVQMFLVNMYHVDTENIIII